MTRKFFNSYIGVRCSCVLEGIKITDAKINYCKKETWPNNGKYLFVCQNKVAGALASDKLGYKYSYWIGNKGSLEYNIKRHKIVLLEDVNCID